MKRALRGLMWVMLSTALVVMVPRAFAQRPPETHPVSTHQDIVMSWDRSALPGNVEIWAPRTLLGYEQAGISGFGRLFLTCISSGDSGRGRCPTQDTHEGSAGVTSRVPLQFVEQRSGMTIDLDLVASLRRADSVERCSSDYWSSTVRPIWSSTAEICGPFQSVGTGIEMTLLQSELQKAVAGHWRATAEFVVRTPPDLELARKVIAFEFTVTDRDAVAIYFPHFDEISPHVGLNLRYDPITQTVGGGTTVDMCLYDGLGSQAPYLGVTVRDSGGRTPGPSGFSAWHRDSGGSDDSARLDYDVTLDYNGAPLPMRNGVEEQLTGIDTAKLRLVVLPGMSQPVFCVDTPLRLNMPRVPIAEKQPGYYRGDLKVELRVPTGVP